MVTRKASRNDCIGATALLTVGHLSSDDGADLIRTQTAAAPHSLLLYAPRRGNHDDPVNIAIPAGFQQQRNIQDSKGFSGGSNPTQERRLFLPDHGMQNALELSQSIRIPQHSVTQRNPIHRPVQYSAGKSRFDGRYRAPTARLQPVDSSIRVKHRDTGATKHRRGGRLPHADAAGQPDDLHPPARSAATNCRSS